MKETILYTSLSLSSIGTMAAIILYFVAQKFKVIEDPRIDEVENLLPAANCGGCGFPGCRAFAEECVKREDLSKLYCPPSGNEGMCVIAEYLGKELAPKEPMVAVVRCGGSIDHRPQINIYDGAKSCAIAHHLYGGQTGCVYGCLGLGDCVVSCKFDAMKIDPKTGLTVVDEEKCTACRACVEACPRNIIELRRKGPKSRRIFVSCVNNDRGAVSRKNCMVSCIGCKRCVKVCDKVHAITVENFLAYIDYNKCVLCRKCVKECPTGAIREINFPPRKNIVKPEDNKENIKNEKKS